MLGGTLAAFMTACVAGFLISDAEIEAGAVKPNVEQTEEAAEQASPADTDAANLNDDVFRPVGAALG